MACTFGSSLTDSCTCLGMTTECGSGKYCYNNQCKSQNTCGDDVCEAECFCVGNGKIATKCLGPNKYCKNGKVMTVCTAASLYTDECACQVGDAGFCGGMCADGICYGVRECPVGVSSETDCVCAADGKKMGIFKKSESTKCTAAGELEPIYGGCGNDTLADEECKCEESGQICPDSKVCRGRACDKQCDEGKCECICAGTLKIGFYCYGSKNQCVNGKIVPTADSLVCSAEFAQHEYCQCSSEAANLCGRSGICDGADCYQRVGLSDCSSGTEVSATCVCSQTQKIAKIAKPGDYCDSSGNVSRKCADGVPSLVEACKCGSFDGPECKKGDVCIEGTCYGTGAGVASGYCEHGKACTAACACADTAFAATELCSGADNYCIDGAIVSRCPAGQGKENGECKPCDANCSECFEDRSTCTKCGSKFKLEAGKCVKSGGGLGIGAIVGIVIAVLVVLAAVCVGILFFLKHKKQVKKPEYQEEKEENEVQVAAE